MLSNPQNLSAQAGADVQAIGRSKIQFSKKFIYKTPKKLYNGNPKNVCPCGVAECEFYPCEQGKKQQQLDVSHYCQCAE